MVRFINAVTGGEMWVADYRATEYEARGHKRAPLEPPEKKPAPAKKRTVKKKKGA